MQVGTREECRAPPHGVGLYHCYYQLNQALEVARSHRARVLAEDSVRYDGSVGKCFMVLGTGAFLEYLQRTSRRYCWYKVIDSASPCRFHLDIEVGVIDALVDRLVSCLMVSKDSCAKSHDVVLLFQGFFQQMFGIYGNSARLV